MRLSIRKLAKKVGVSATVISNIKRKPVSLPTAIRIEKATGGEIKTEDIVRPEVAEALREYLRLRCSMNSNIVSSSNGQSVEDKGETTVEVER